MPNQSSGVMISKENPTIRLRIFIGFKGRSKYHTSKDFEALGVAISHRLKRINPKIDTHFKLGEFNAGEKLWEEIYKSITNCDIAIFDISDNSPNVMIEAGVGYGSGKRVILIRCNRSKQKRPTDLHPTYVFIPYDKCSEFVSAPFLKLISDSVKSLLNSSDDRLFYFRHLWSLDPHSTTYIVPGILPKSFGKNPLEDYVYLRECTDLDAVLLTSNSLTRIYPNMNVHVQAARELKELPDWKRSNLVIIGGPDYNRIANELQLHCPIEYMYGKHPNEVWLRHKNEPRRKYVPKMFGTGDDAIFLDYGFFVKTHFMGMPSRKLIFLGGARTWGVLGAAALVACHAPNAGENNEKNPPEKAIVTRLGSDPSFLIPIKIKGNLKHTEHPEWDLKDIEPLDCI